MSTGVRNAVRTGALGFTLAAGLMAGLLPGTAEEPLAPDDGIAGAEQAAGDMFLTFADDFDRALSALDEANAELDKAIGLQDYDAALETVDRLLSRVNNLMDRIQPGNPTEARVDRLLGEIDTMIRQVQTDPGLREDDRNEQLLRFERNREGLVAQKEQLRTSYRELQDLAEELKSRKRAAAYDLINLANERAIERLAAANEKISGAIAQLREGLNRLRPAFTN